MRFLWSPRLALLAVSSLHLAACGGGSADGGDSPDASPPAVRIGGFSYAAGDNRLLHFTLSNGTSKATQALASTNIFAVGAAHVFESGCPAAPWALGPGETSGPIEVEQMTQLAYPCGDTTLFSANGFTFEMSGDVTLTLTGTFADGSTFTASATGAQE